MLFLSRILPEELFKHYRGFFFHQRDREPSVQELYETYVKVLGINHPYPDDVDKIKLIRAELQNMRTLYDANVYKYNIMHKMSVYDYLDRFEDDEDLNNLKQLFVEEKRRQQWYYACDRLQELLKLI
jgi:hypothetical protein